VSVREIGTCFFHSAGPVAIFPFVSRWSSFYFRQVEPGQHVVLKSLIFKRHPAHASLTSSVESPKMRFRQSTKGLLFETEYKRARTVGGECHVKTMLLQVA